VVGTSNMNIVNLKCVPFTGLGLFDGYRGDEWLKNRLAVFNEYVLPSLLNRNPRDFYVWFCWRPEEKINPIVQEFQKSLEGIKDLSCVHTFGGVPFYDDKYSELIAQDRLLRALEISLPELKHLVSEADEVHVELQPSDDCYVKN